MGAAARRAMLGAARIEELMIQLREDYTLVVATHNMQEAARGSPTRLLLGRAAGGSARAC